MRILDCTVLHAGNQNMRLRKIGVTVAEVAVLQAIHGRDAVTEIEPRHNDRRSHAEEFERLCLAYPKTQDDVTVPHRLWPGINPKLPADLADIGITVTDLMRQRAEAEDAAAAEAEAEEVAARREHMARARALSPAGKASAAKAAARAASAAP